MPSRRLMLILLMIMAGVNVVIGVMNEAWFNLAVAVYLIAMPGRAIATMPTIEERRRRRLLAEAMKEVDDVDVIVTLDEIDQRRLG